MSPSFNPAERRRIVNQLRETALELFTTRGLRKTTLDELVAPVGISKSSFYSFFPSKEALYLDLALEQVATIRPRLIAASTRPDHARAGIAALLREIVDILDHNPLYRRLLAHPEELVAVADRLGERELDRVQTELVQPLLDVVERAQHAGQVIKADPATVVGVLQAVLLVPVHARELDPRTYPAVLDLLIETVAEGLTSR